MVSCKSNSNLKIFLLAKTAFYVKTSIAFLPQFKQQTFKELSRRAYDKEAHNVSTLWTLKKLNIVSTSTQPAVNILYENVLDLL